MAISSELDCGVVFGQFTKEEKFADATKKYFESRNNYFKLTKHSTEYLFSIAEVTSIVPLHFIPIFQAIHSIVSVVFEGFSIFQRINKIRSSQEELALCKTKIEKWKSDAVDERETTPDINRLNILRDRYLGKIQTLEDKPEKEKFDRFRKARWEEYLTLINDAIDGSDPKAADVLRDKFARRKDRKVDNWENRQNNLKMKIKKSYVGIAISVGVIALEIITLVGIAFIPVDAGLTFTAIKLGSNLLVSAMKYGKYLWWNLNKNEKPGLIAIKSIEHIGVAVAKTKLLPFSSIVHPSLIKGACKTAITSIRLYGSRHNFIDNNNAIGECKIKIESLRRKKIEIMQSSEKIASGDHHEMLRVMQKYEDKRVGAIQIIEQCNHRLDELQREEDAADRDEILGTIGILTADIKKWKSYIDAINHAMATNDLSDAKVAADVISEKNAKKFSNWCLSEQLHKKNNLKEGMKTALSIVEIARFAFLVTAVSLTLVGIGVNLLPYLFASSLLANALYLGYAWFTLKTNKEIDGIIDLWSRDEVPQSVA